MKSRDCIGVSERRRGFDDACEMGSPVEGDVQAASPLCVVGCTTVIHLFTFAKLLTRLDGAYSGRPSSQVVDANAKVKIIV